MTNFVFYTEDQEIVMMQDFSTYTEALSHAQSLSEEKQESISCEIESVFQYQNRPRPSGSGRIG